jgi:predicted house-cleaning noncanonical NTP pyrophosphatase (MazG superfamily)
MSETRTFNLNKLVRDKIVENLIERGGEVAYEKLEGEQLIEALLAKLHEEVGELGDEISLEELADIAEVVEAIALAKGHRRIELDSAKYDKHKEKGGFAAGHFVTRVTLPVDDEMAQYFASDPKRFPEN